MRYINPVISGFHPDSSLCRAGEDYFLVTSSFEYFPGVPLFRSRDLVHWRQIGHCLTRPSQFPLGTVPRSGGIWAPTIRYHDGRFYMITTDMLEGRNFIVHAEDPFGEWSEPVSVAIKSIDPSLCFADGACYLTAPSWTPQGMVTVEIDPLTGKLLTEPRSVWKGFSPWGAEGPHLYKIGDFYYLL
jgi:alpha-N-arabinofuranosidase